MPVNKDDTYQIDEKKVWFQKWWPENVPKTVQFEEKSLNDILDEKVKIYQDKNLMWFLHTWVSYSEFHEYVLKFATALYKLGVRKGDVVALHLPNSIQYVVSYYAVIRIGAIVSGINPTYKPIEILHQLQAIKST